MGVRVRGFWLLFGGLFIQLLLASEYLTDFLLMRHFVFPVFYVHASITHLAILQWTMLFSFPLAYAASFVGWYYLENRMYFLLSQVGLIAMVIAIIAGFYV